MNITFTQNAKDKLVKLCREDGYIGLQHLRVQVRGGGCSGFRYGLEFDEKPPTEFDETSIIFEDAALMNFLKIVLVVDPLSLQYLDGMTIDHVSTTMGEGFQFFNPNVTAKCGCGNSFSV